VADQRPAEGTRSLVRTILVQGFVDAGRDGLDFSAEFLLDTVEVVSVVIGDQVDGEAQVSEASGAPHSVQIRLGVSREVKVDDHVHGLNVDTAGEEVGGHEVATSSLLELVEHSVSC